MRHVENSQYWAVPLGIYSLHFRFTNKILQIYVTRANIWARETDISTIHMLHNITTLCISCSRLYYYIWSIFVSTIPKQRWDLLPIHVDITNKNSKSDLFCQGPLWTIFFFFFPPWEIEDMSPTHDSLNLQRAWLYASKWLHQNNMPQTSAFKY